MFTIGEFSKVTGMTVKTIRFYHERGLLVPTSVDEATGYRYYDRSKLETARAISHLRKLDLSLDEIGEILRTASDDGDLRHVMSRQKTLIEGKIVRYRQIARSIEQFLDQEEEVKRIMAQATFRVAEKTISPLRVAGVRMKGSYGECCVAFAKIARRFGRQIRGKPMLLQFDTEFKENDAEFEACIPIGAGTSCDGIIVRELPGGRGASIMHLGPYDQLGRSYERILDYVRDKGYEITVPTREVYQKGPGMILRGNPKKYLTEIQMLILSSHA